MEVEQDLSKLIAKAIEAPLLASPNKDGICEADAPSKARKVPDREVIKLGFKGEGQPAVVNTVSLEQHILPQARWEIVFDDDGDAFLNPDDDDLVPVVIDALFKYRIYRLEDNSLALRPADGSSNWISMPSFESKFVSATASMPLGATRAWKTFDVSRLKYPRHPAAIIFWSCKSIYENLGFTHYNGRQWRWSGKPHCFTWRNILDTFGVQQHCMPSSQLKCEGHNETLMFPHTSLSCWALLVLLTKWQNVAKKTCMTTNAHRVACREMLEALVTPLANDDFSFACSLFEQWENEWPLRTLVPQGATLPINTCGMVNLGSFVGEVSSAEIRGHWTLKPLERLHQAHGDAVPLVDFLDDLDSHDDLLPLYQQVVWHLGDRLQRNMISCLDGGFLPDFGMELPPWSECLERSGVLDRKLVEYVETGKFVAKNQTYYSGCSDKAAVGGLGSGLTSTCFGVAPNFLIMAVPQVGGAFLATSECNTNSEKTAVVKNTNFRHRCWVAKGQNSPKATPWRPRRVFRKVAQKGLDDEDNQIKYSLGLRGWVDFIVPKPEQRANTIWANWRTWRHMLFVRDQASDNLCRARWLASIKANITDVIDWSHAFMNCEKDTLREENLMGFWMLAMIVMNLNFGHNADETRYAQLSECWQNIKKLYCSGPGGVPALLESWMPKILRGLSFTDHAFGKSAAHDTPSKHVLSLLDSDPGFVQVGHKVNLNRYASGSRKMRDEFADKWWMHAFRVSFTAIESDMCISGKFKNFVVKESSSSSGGKATPASHTAEVAKALKSCCGNAMEIAVAFLESDWNEAVAKCIIEAFESTDTTQGTSNTELRSYEDSGDWLLKQLEGGFMQSVRDIWDGLEKVSKLQHIGFTMPHADGDSAFFNRPDVNDAIVLEDDLAEVYGGLCLSLSSQYLRRFLHVLRGWPLKFRLLLSEVQGLAQETIDQFAKDQRASERLAAAESKSSKMVAMENRDQFVTSPVEQYSEAFKECGYHADPDIVHMADHKTKGIIQTQPSEESFNMMKNSKLVKGKKRYRRPEKAMGVVIAGELANKRHRFDALDTSVVPPAKRQCIRLPDEAFRKPDSIKPSLPTNKLSGTSPSLGFYSPNATNHGQNSADLQLKADALDNDESFTKYCANAWQGWFVSSKHRLVFRENGSSQLYLALYHYTDSSCLVAKVTEHTLENSDWKYYVPGFGKYEPDLLTVIDSTQYEGKCVRFRSPAWQNRESSGVCKEEAVRLFELDKSDFKPVDTLAADNAFWAIGIDILKVKAESMGVNVPAGATLFVVLFLLISELLKIPDEAVLAKCLLRLNSFQVHSIWGQELLDVDEGASVLTREDEKKLHEEQRDAQRAAFESEEFEHNFRDKRHELRNKPGAKAKAGPKPPKVKTSKLPHFPECNISVAIAKQYVPPNCSLWKDVKFGSWQGHFEPYPRCGRSFSKYGGEHGALLEALKYLWGRFLFRFDLDEKDCPLKGIFQD